MISTVEKVLFLKKVDLFSKIPGEDLAKVAEIVKETSFEAGEQIIREGDMGDCLYLIIEGEVDVVAGERQLACLGLSECFGEMSLLDSEPRSACVVAKTDVALLKIEQDDFYEMMTERPEVAQGVISVLTRRLREAIK